MNIYCNYVEIDLNYKTPKVILKDQTWIGGLYKARIDDDCCDIIELESNNIIFTSDKCMIFLNDSHHKFYCLLGG